MMERIYVVVHDQFDYADNDHVYEVSGNNVLDALFQYHSDMISDVEYASEQNCASWQNKRFIRKKPTFSKNYEGFWGIECLEKYFDNCHFDYKIADAEVIKEYDIDFSNCWYNNGTYDEYEDSSIVFYLTLEMPYDGEPD